MTLRIGQTVRFVPANQYNNIGRIIEVADWGGQRCYYVMWPDNTVRAYREDIIAPACLRLSINIDNEVVL